MKRELDAFARSAHKNMKAYLGTLLLKVNPYLRLNKPFVNAFLGWVGWMFGARPGNVDEALDWMNGTFEYCPKDHTRAISQLMGLLNTRTSTMSPADFACFAFFRASFMMTARDVDHDFLPFFEANQAHIINVCVDELMRFRIATPRIRWRLDGENAHTFVRQLASALSKTQSTD